VSDIADRSAVERGTTVKRDARQVRAAIVVGLTSLACHSRSVDVAVPERALVAVDQWAARGSSGTSLKKIRSQDPLAPGGPPTQASPVPQVTPSPHCLKQKPPQSQILDNFPALRAADLVNVWAYVDAHADEIETAIRENDEA
jgi:hypothetical protein